jgi:hypothetical protein
MTGKATAGMRRPTINQGITAACRAKAITQESHRTIEFDLYGGRVVSVPAQPESGCSASSNVVITESAFPGRIDFVLAVKLRAAMMHAT